PIPFADYLAADAERVNTTPGAQPAYPLCTPTNPGDPYGPQDRIFHMNSRVPDDMLIGFTQRPGSPTAEIWAKRGPDGGTMSVIRPRARQRHHFPRRSDD
ncbi:MAG: hypothetical protein LC793_17940, partial [Thermomicrobia bacterium]|nr:hypothetical protein [Thermomicrobia bacterium]